MKRWVVGFVLLFFIAAVTWIVTRPDKYHTAKRRAWADRALAALRNEPRETARNDAEWVQSQWLYFKNGEWIDYRSQCHKEDPAVYDIFVGRGSDGNWYYSTFHFCRDVCVLRMGAQPESLADFIRDYALVKFDGVSEVCLQPTWPAVPQYR